MPAKEKPYEVGPHIFKKPQREPNTRAGQRSAPNSNQVATYPGHVTTPAPVKNREMVAKQRQYELSLCAGYPMIFGLPRERVMGSAENAAHVRAASARPEAREAAERYALAARPPEPKEEDYRRRDANRQVLDLRTGRPLIETVLSDENTYMPPRKQGTRVFPQAYRNSEVAAEDIPRAARHEMESMPASYKTNLVRTLCMLYPKFTAESRLSRQRQAHMVGPKSMFPGQGLQHSQSRMGIAEAAGKAATKEVTSRPNNIRVVSLMRTAA